VVAFFFEGNATCTAEANIYNDPKAAKLVFNSKWNQCVIAPMNITHKIFMDDIFLEQINGVGIVGTVIIKSHDHYIRVLVERYGNDRNAIPCHDPVPVVYFLRPDIFESVTGFVDVELDGKLTTGLTLIDTKGYLKDDPNYENKSTVLVDCDKLAFKRIIVDTLRNRMNELDTKS